MIALVAAAGVLAPGLDHRLRLLLVGSFVAPIPTAVAVSLLVARSWTHHGPDGSDAATALLLDVAAGLRSGRTLRECVSSVHVDVARLVAIGADPEPIGAALARRVPRHGDMVSAAFEILDTAGGPAASVFEELAVQTAEDERVRREVRAAVAAPVLQGVILGGAPVVVVIQMVASGRMGDVIARSSAHAISVAAGVVLTAVGVVWVWRIVRKALP